MIIVGLKNLNVWSFGQIYDWICSKYSIKLEQQMLDTHVHPEKQQSAQAGKMHNLIFIK